MLGRQHQSGRLEQGLATARDLRAVHVGGNKVHLQMCVRSLSRRTDTFGVS